jgi:hypothetical protein
MSNILPKGEDLRKVVKGIPEEHQYSPDRNYRNIIEEACLRFNLSSMDAEYLPGSANKKTPEELAAGKPLPQNIMRIILQCEFGYHARL